MKFLDLEQKSDAWLNWRKKIIGSSDIASVMEESPYMTKRELFYDKKDCWPYKKEENFNFIMEKGNLFEIKARDEYSKFTKTEFYPFVVESDCGRFGASLDGFYKEEGRGIEIKLMGEQDYRNLVDNDVIPKHYYYQIQWQMSLASLETVDLIAGNIKAMIVLTVERNDKTIKNLMDKAEEFYEDLQSNKMPPLSSKDLYVINKDDNYNKFYEQKEYIENLKLKLKHEEEKFSEYVKFLTDISPTDNCLYGDFKLTKVTRKGAIDYSQIIKEGINPEDYRKPSTQYWMVNFKKGEK